MNSNADVSSATTRHACCMQLDRLVTQIGSQGNETISERLEAQIEACGMNFTLLSTNGSPRASAYGSLVVPLVVLLASMLLLGLLGP